VKSLHLQIREDCRETCYGSDCRAYYNCSNERPGESPWAHANGLQLNDQLSGVSEGLPIKRTDLVFATPTSRNSVTTVNAVVFWFLQYVPSLKIIKIMFCWPCIIVYQYSKTNVMHFLFSWLRIKPLHISRITCSSSGGVTQTALGILRACYVSWLHRAVCVAPPEDEKVMLETYRGP
jgi:hypothetical protein